MLDIILDLKNKSTVYKWVRQKLHKDNTCQKACMRKYEDCRVERVLRLMLIKWDRRIEHVFMIQIT